MKSLGRLAFLVMAATGCSRPSPLASCVKPALLSVEYAGARFDVVCVPLAKASVRVYWKDPAGKAFGSLEALAASLPEPAIAITNAGIFEPGQVPTGLLISGGQTLHALNVDAGEGNFYLAPNGVFFVGSDGAAVMETSAFARRGDSDVRDATQSGPLLVAGGTIHRQFARRSTNTAIRSGVGVRGPHEVWLAISRSEVNLWTFAALFRDRLGCEDALYLDGAISELITPSLGRAPPTTPPDPTTHVFSGMLAVEPRR